MKMKPGVIANFPWFSTQNNAELGSSFEPNNSTVLIQTKQSLNFDVKLWGLSLLSFVPWLAVRATDKPAAATERAHSHRALPRPRRVVGSDFQGTRLRFRPYVSKVPWHTGVRAFLSQLFPRYGHYCGPNWSSGKDNGSLIWDRRPIDWLDYCCYCHDIGYDSHDQAELLRADLAFLECLERPNMKTRGDAHVARIYKTMCTTGLRSLLIPYRTNLVKLQLGKPLVQFGWLSNVRWKSWIPPKT